MVQNIRQSKVTIQQDCKLNQFQSLAGIYHIIISKVDINQAQDQNSISTNADSGCIG